jgi:hypothetical protein
MDFMQRKIIEANCSNPVHNKWEQAFNGSLLRLIFLKSFTCWNLHRRVYVSRVESFNIPFFHTRFSKCSVESWRLSLRPQNRSECCMHSVSSTAGGSQKHHRYTRRDSIRMNLNLSSLRTWESVRVQDVFCLNKQNRESTTKSPCSFFTHKNTFAFSTLAFHCNHVHCPCLWDNAESCKQRSDLRDHSSSDVPVGHFYSRARRKRWRTQ